MAVTEETRRTGVQEVDDTLAISSEDCVGEWIRITNELVADICDRMLSRYGYARWFREEPDPRDLMRSRSPQLDAEWPISTRVNKPENDDPSIVEPIQLSTDAA